MEAKTYISLDVLAIRTGLPRAYLREQAACGTIPAIRAGRWLRFDETAVREALSKLAQRTAKPQPTVAEDPR